ncbi:MAG TPA: AAA domain-containing protein, partial [Tenuifilaceae bacterium]|nr:AAA domain-containing protein [Tenuifilaceae bacterium]
FIYREIQVAKVGSSDSYNKSNGFADLWKASKVEKLENTDVLVELEVNEVTDNFHISLNLKKDLFSSNNANISSFRGGDLAILYPTPNQNELNPLSSQILKCYVVSVDYTSVTVSLINKQVDKSFFNSTKFWALERDFRESGYKQLFNLLYQFIKSNKRVIDLVLGVEKPTFNNELNIQKNELDEVQHLNVQNAVRANDYYLIQGPPGTGKTSKVLVEIVRNSIKPDKAIMVVAFTNRAVDQICEKLIELKVDCIRLGKGDKPYYWSSLSGRLKLDELNEEVKKHNVFVSTISTFSNSLDLLKFKNFDTIIIDEASQVLEPQVVGFLKHFSKWIFIGDENQLPAVVLQSEDDSKCDVKELNDISLLNYRESLFYRLKKNAIKKGWHNCYGTLKYQYRMHRDIAEFPKKYFYNNELEEANEDQKGKMPNYSAFNDDAINQVLTKSRVVFIPSKVDLNSKTNMEEASLVASLINHIAKLQGKDFNPEKSVGVITPFRAQIVNIRNQLGARYREVTIDTVERFQGSERNIIIVSFAIKSPVQLGAIQSLNDEGIDRKLNVALTRAKDLLILIGSETVLEKSNVFKNLIDFTKSKGGYMLNPLKVKTIPKNLF